MHIHMNEDVKQVNIGGGNNYIFILDTFLYLNQNPVIMLMNSKYPSNVLRELDFIC